MFNASQAQSKFLKSIEAIEFGQLGIGIDPTGLKLRGAAIALAGELFAKFIKELAEDADASMSIGRVHASDTGFIADTCHDIAGQIVNGAEIVLEAAE